VHPQGLDGTKPLGFLLPRLGDQAQQKDMAIWEVFVHPKNSKLPLTEPFVLLHQ
jgi:hypothetical protein